MNFAQRCTQSVWFGRLSIAMILAAGVLVGLETHAPLVAAHKETLHTLDVAVLVFFWVELLLKVAAEYPKPWRFLRDPWNVFDAFIVISSTLPMSGAYLTVLRLLRLLRVLRLLKALPKLQLLINALLRSIPSMGYVGMLLGLLFYVYGVAGVFLFGGNDPARFGTLGSAMLTLFTVVTLEGWADIMYTQAYGCNTFATMLEGLCNAPSAQPILAPLYFISFVLLGTMITLNLFIGVIMNSMQEAKDDQNQQAGSGKEASDLDELKASLVQMQKLVANLERKART